MGISIDFKSAYKFHQTMNEFEPMFEDFIEENNNSNTAVFLAIAVAMRIAAKLSKKFKTTKESFLETAKVNFEMEDSN